MSDSELLKKYVAEGSEEALEELIRRHAGLVYSTCLRRLGNEHDAEDATQAVFIALTWKARTIRKASSLASWLYWVAECSARKIQRERARKSKRDAEAAKMRMQSAGPDEDQLWQDVRPALDDAVSALPRRYRDVVVLRYLDGRSEDEVARELGCPRSTIATRLSRGLEKIRSKLAARGVVAGSVTLTSLIAGRALEAAPAHLVKTVAAACTGKAAAAGAVSIAEGVMNMMMWAKVKLVAVCVTGLAIAGGVTTPLVLSALAEEGTVPGPKGGTYGKFNDFCIKHFGAEKEPLVYEKFGETLKFLDKGAWMHASEASSCIGFETNLPAKAYVEYGPTRKYGSRTSEHERHFYLHLHYLKDLKPNATYHYRFVAVDERGKKVVTEDAVFVTKKSPGAIHVPGNMQGPPYLLDKAGATYVLTKDLTIDGKAFDVKADNITLDLGGHTVIYNNKRMEIALKLSSTIWRKDAHYGVNSQVRKGLTVLNGRIKQGAGDNGAGSYSCHRLPGRGPAAAAPVSDTVFCLVGDVAVTRSV